MVKEQIGRVETVLNMNLAYKVHVNNSMFSMIVKAKA
jgi:hypothetical protein